MLTNDLKIFVNKLFKKNYEERKKKVIKYF